MFIYNRIIYPYCFDVYNLQQEKWSFSSLEHDMLNLGYCEHLVSDVRCFVVNNLLFLKPKFK